MSPEVRNRGISGPKNGHPPNIFEKKCTVEIQCIGNIIKLDFFCERSLMFRPAGSYSTNTSTWTADTQILSAKQSKNVNFTELLNYNHGDKDDKDDDDSPLWMVLMDQSQLIMTIVGLAANMATTSVLIKNGQVVILENKHR